MHGLSVDVEGSGAPELKARLRPNVEAQNDLCRRYKDAFAPIAAGRQRSSIVPCPLGFTVSPSTLNNLVAPELEARLRQKVEAQPPSAEVIRMPSRQSPSAGSAPP